MLIDNLFYNYNKLNISFIKIIILLNLLKIFVLKN